MLDIHGPAIYLAPPVRFAEVEALMGSVVRRGRAAGIPTPVLATFYGLLEPHEHGRRQP